MYVEFEFEKLGNYYTRDVEMMELDRYLDYIEEKNLYLHIATHNNINDELNPNNNYNSNWHGNPYNENAMSSPEYKGISGVDDQIEFYTSPIAKKLYKNRLRYFESRWGYSSNIYAFELLGEINVSDDNYWGPAPSSPPPHTYDPSQSINDEVESWIDEMAGYMKNELKSHMRMTTCYGQESFTYFYGDPDGDGIGEEITWADPYTMFTSPNIDIVMGKSYPSAEWGNRFHQEGVKRMALNVPNKPIINPEVGVGGPRSSATEDLFVEVNHITDIADHNNTWSSAFSGLSGTCLNWIWYRYRDCDIGSYCDLSFPYRNEYEINYGAIKSFFGQYNLKDYAYTPNVTVQKCPTSYSGICDDVDKKQFETHYLTRSDQKVLLGWFHNRSYNHFNYPYDAACQRLEDINNIADLMYYNNEFQNLAPQTVPHYGGIFYNLDNYADSFNGTDNLYQYYPKPEGTLTLQALPNTNYIANWYWTWGESGGEIYSNSNYSGTMVMSDANGYVSFTHPPTGDQDGISNTGDEYPGDWAFELIQVGATRSAKTELPKHEIKDYHMQLYPNPTSGFFTITSENQNLGTVKITNMLGQAVYTAKNIQSNSINIKLQNIATGVYLVEVIGSTQAKPWYSKIVIE